MKKTVIVGIVLLYWGFGLLNGSDIHLAVKKGELDTVKRLIQEKPDLLNSLNNRNRTPLDEACIRGRLAVAKYLYELGAKTAHHSPVLQTVHGYAHPKTKLDLVAYFLLKDKTQAQKPNDLGITPLHWAGNEMAETIEMLLNCGAEINARDKNGYTALHHYTQWWRKDNSELLIRKGADIDAVDMNGRTSLHWAAIIGRAEKTALLLKYHANREIKDRFGKTAIDYSIKYAHRDVYDLLNTNGTSRGFKVADPLWSKNISKSEAMIRYLDGHGWLIRTEKHLLIFDYEDWQIKPSKPSLRNGWLVPEQIGDRNVLMFISNQRIYQEKYANWGKQIKRFKLINGSNPKRKFWKFDDVQIQFLKANEGGFAFLIRIDGLNIYHGGRHWLSSDSRIAEFKKAFSDIDGRMDIAIIPITFAAGLDSIHMKGFGLTVEALSPRLVIPSGGAGTQKFMFTLAGKLLMKSMPKIAVFYAFERGATVQYPM